MKKLSLLLLAALALGGCKKNDDANAPAGPSKADLLTAKSWRPSAAVLSVTVAGIATPVGSFGACDKDDIVTFNTDKSLVHDAGATKCDATDPQTERGSWSMPNDSKLNLVLPSSSSLSGGTFDIKELSATTLHLVTTETQSGITYTADVTFTAL
jgi:hypothetical protein